MGQFGVALSPLDNLIIAMGRAGDRRAVPVILEKAKLLSAQDDFLPSPGGGAGPGANRRPGRRQASGRACWQDPASPATSTPRLKSPRRRGGARGDPTPCKPDASRSVSCCWHVRCIAVATTRASASRSSRPTPRISAAIWPDMPKLYFKPVTKTDRGPCYSLRSTSARLGHKSVMDAIHLPAWNLMCVVLGG